MAFTRVGKKRVDLNVQHCMSEADELPASIFRDFFSNDGPAEIAPWFTAKE